MPIVVGVAFKPLGKITPCDPGALELAVDDAVIAQGEAGLEFGFVKTPARAVPDEDAPAPVRAVLRRALPDDWQRRERGERRQAEAFRVCKEKIGLLGLPMKLIEAEWAFDGAASDASISLRKGVWTSANWSARSPPCCTRGYRCIRSGRATMPASSPASVPAAGPPAARLSCVSSSRFP